MSASRSVTCSVHAYIRYRVNNPQYDWRWRYGLRNKDIPASFWAVMPLSFMVDRVFDVSSMIQAVTNLSDPSVQILGAGHTIKRTETYIRQHTSSTANTSTYPRLTYSGKGPRVVDTVFTMTRSSFTPQFGNVVPSFNPKGLIADFTKSVDLVALLRMLSR